ncbi:hypothetical protein [Oceanobacter mangrovi]|uniref:hypothetical protein n=1 Tax=Oceanobacter mangrovi TaxID=2862510 RepID=UPI001C8E9FAC|nr:hypothetical protein [Oceanobacter mangrovi]
MKIPSSSDYLKLQAERDDLAAECQQLKAMFNKLQAEAINTFAERILEICEAGDLPEDLTVYDVRQIATEYIRLHYQESSS